MERFFENAMYASRWLLAPVYFGLSLALVALCIKFFQEIFHVLPDIFSIAEADLILVLLSLVDMTLVGGLLVMVMFSGYENFVSQLDISEHKEKLSWLGKMDASSLKNKVAASIVAISSIHLLRVFMDAKNVPDNKLMWYVIIHLTFVLSAFAMGYLDKIVRSKYTHLIPLPTGERVKGRTLFIRRRLPQIQFAIRNMPINPFQLIFGKAQVIQRLNILFQLFRPTRTNQH